MVSSKVTIRKFKMLYFRNERYHATRWLKKDLFLGLLQPHLDANSEDLETLILEFESPENHLYVCVVDDASLRQLCFDKPAPGKRFSKTKNLCMDPPHRKTFWA